LFNIKIYTTQNNPSDWKYKINSTVDYYTFSYPNTNNIEYFLASIQPRLPGKGIVTISPQAAESNE
jgi:hypothetical protein